MSLKLAAFGSDLSDTVDVIRSSWGWRRKRSRQDCHTEKR